MFDIQILLILFIILILVFILILILYKFKKDNNILKDNFTDIRDVSEDDEAENKIYGTENTENKFIVVEGEPGPIGPPGPKGEDGKECVPCKEPETPEPLPLFKFIKQRINDNEPEIILGQYPPKESYPTVEEIAHNNLNEIVIQIPIGEQGLQGDSITGPTGGQGEKGDTLECSDVCQTGAEGPPGPDGPPGEPGRGIVNITLTDDYKLKIKYTDNSEQIIDKRLKGEKGETGLNGVNGSDGENGEKGDTWFPSYNSDSGIITYNLNGRKISTEDLRSKCTQDGRRFKWLDDCPSNNKKKDEDIIEGFSFK
tara:strand:- start:14358 stop:15293 length:936 start_codon:yes stop_codon:yes gene_type:complete